MNPVLDGRVSKDVSSPFTGCWVMLLCLFTLTCADPADPEAVSVTDAVVVDRGTAATDDDSSVVDLSPAPDDDGVVDGGPVLDAMVVPDMEPLPPEGIHCFDEPLEVVAQGMIHLSDEINEF